MPSIFQERGNREKKNVGFVILIQYFHGTSRKNVEKDAVENFYL